MAEVPGYQQTPIRVTAEAVDFRFIPDERFKCADFCQSVIGQVQQGQPIERSDLICSLRHALSTDHDLSAVRKARASTSRSSPKVVKVL